MGGGPETVARGRGSEHHLMCHRSKPGVASSQTTKGQLGTQLREDSCSSQKEGHVYIPRIKREYRIIESLHAAPGKKSTFMP